MIEIVLTNVMIVETFSKECQYGNNVLYVPARLITTTQNRISNLY